MAHILVVCTANVCRSPVGEAILRRCLHEKGLRDWVVSSAGTSALDGSPATPYSVQLVAERAIDITVHRARSVNEALLAGADLVLCLESSHVEAINSNFPAAAGKVYLLSEMAGRRCDVADPFGGPLLAYRRMIAEVSELVEKGMARTVELAQRRADSREGPAGQDRRVTTLQ